MTVEEMEDLLDRLGIEIVSINGDEIKAHCPAHLERKGKEDTNPSWYINADTGAHNCFSCHFKGGVSSLVEYVQGVGSEVAKQWVNSGERNLTRAFEKLFTPTPTPEQTIPITESMLSAFISPPDYALKSRGITPIAADYYGIVWNSSNESWILPIRDPYTNKLIGWQEKWFKERRFNNYPPKVSKSSTLFGYERYSGDSMVVVESPLDVARLASIGVLGGVAVCGSAVSKDQINLIRSSSHIIFAMDNDSAGLSSSSTLLEYSKAMGFDCWFFNYDQTDMKDIGAMSKAEIMYGLENSKHSIQGKRAFL
jgi:5S rRNA maturation endonuclease (ribonuclease M5)